MGLASNPDRVQWSALNDHRLDAGHEQFRLSDVPGRWKGAGIDRGDEPADFPERSIFKATLQPGSVEIFTFQKIHDRRGAASAGSIASRGSFTFYADQGGFFQIGQDGSIAPIGFLKVDKTLFGLMTAPDSRSIMAAIDPFYSRVIGRSRVFVTFNRLCGLRLGHPALDHRGGQHDGYLSGRDDGLQCWNPSPIMSASSTHCRSRWTARRGPGGAPLSARSEKGIRSPCSAASHGKRF